MILLVEDDSTLAVIIADALERNGFEVTIARDGVDGLRLSEQLKPRLVIADVMMPRMDGFEMARKIRRRDQHVPILFLTARSGIDDIVEGFELGGNDYLKKPFKMLELIVRVKALSRNYQSSSHVVREIISIGAYRFDPAAQTLAFADETRQLSHIEARILETLAVSMGQMVEASTLQQEIWQREDPWTRNSLHGFIHRLRQYLDRDPHLALLNHRARGYSLTYR